MNHVRLCLVATITIALLTSCAAQPTPVQSALVPPTEPTLTHTAVPTRTVTPSPTSSPSPTSTSTPSATPTTTATPTLTITPTPTHPLSIEAMRQRPYPGGELVIEREADQRSNYTRYVASYPSDGLKVYALLTIPDGEPPETGWPVILFNHGYIPPAEYTTTGRYIAYVDVFARNGYIVLQSDYRGHGESEGAADNIFTSPAYTVDVLNALASLETLPQADTDRVGIWGHSMGGHVSLRAMVVSDQIKAGVIWAGMVSPQAEMMYFLEDRLEGPAPADRRTPPWRDGIFAAYGTPEESPAFWDAISPTTYLADLSGPLQLHHSDTDTSVPLWYSERLAERLDAVGAPYEFYAYAGDNHNLTESFVVAMQRSLAFFDEYVKGHAE